MPLSSQQLGTAGVTVGHSSNVPSGTAVERFLAARSLASLYCRTNHLCPGIFLYCWRLQPCRCRARDGSALARMLLCFAVAEIWAPAFTCCRLANGAQTPSLTPRGVMSVALKKAVHMSRMSGQQASTQRLRTAASGYLRVDCTTKPYNKPLNVVNYVQSCLLQRPANVSLALENAVH